MTEQKKLKQSYGAFDLVGTITVIPNETFQVDLKGKNTPTYNYSKINMRMEDEEGGTFYLNAMDGFDTVKPYPIYANIKDSTTNEQMEVAFADRHNQEILKHLDQRSFVGVALQKKENKESNRGWDWDYTNFLRLYDVINFIKDRLQTGMKIRVTGRTRYNMYNDSIQTEYQIGNIFLLDEKDQNKSGFTFRQDVIIKEDSVDMSEWEEKSIAKVNAEVLMRIKKQDNLFKLPLILRAKDDEDKEQRKKVIDKFLQVESGKVRRIKLEGKYNVGYVGGHVTEADLPEEALELLELGLYDKEEVMKMYVSRERVDELLIIRPVIQRKQGEKPQIDWSDTDYSIADLASLDVQVPWEKEITIEASNDDDLSFLDNLD